MEGGDLLTCGECHLVFSLSDIVSFIRHKQMTCRGSGGLLEPDRSDADEVDQDDDDDDDDTADRGCVNGTAPAAAVLDLIDNVDKTVVRTNGTESRPTTLDSHQDERPASSGS